MAMDDKLTSQRKSLEALKQQFIDETVADGIPYTQQEVEILIKKIPIAIFNQGNELTTAMLTYKEAKRNLKKVYNQKLIEANFDSDFKSANERKAFAENSKEYDEAEQDLIIAEGNWRAAELHYKAYENLFTAVKKIAGLIEDQNKAASRGY